MKIGKEKKIWDKFRSELFTIKVFTKWTVVLRHKQLTLGSCVFILNEYKEAFSTLTQEEFGDLANVVQWYENFITSHFNAVHFNYLALMMKDPHVHIHAIPRYDKSIIFADYKWIDSAYPKSVSMKMDNTSDDVLFKIKSKFEVY